MQLGTLSGSFVPSNKVQSVKERIMDCLLECMTVAEDSVKLSIVDNITSFISKKHVDLALSWANKKHIHLEGIEENLFDLGTNHLHSIVETIFKTNTDQAIKESLLGQVLGDDKSDKAKNLRLTCRATSSDPKIKEEIWDALTDP
jgi:hypothetical protein